MRASTPVCFEADTLSPTGEGRGEGAFRAGKQKLTASPLQINHRLSIALEHSVSVNRALGKPIFALTITSDN
jgi:hypothetical protein